MTATAGVITGGLGLAVSLYVLWSTRLRPPHLVLAAEPGSYRTAFEPERFLLRFPVVVANRGARNGVVTGLRFRVPQEWESTETYALVHRVYAAMDRDEPESRRFFEPLPVMGGATAVALCEFHVARVEPDNVTAGNYPITLEVPVANDGTVVWRKLGYFQLRVTDHERAGFDRPMTHFNGFRS